MQFSLDMTAGGSYVEAAINSWGVSDEQSEAVAIRIRKNLEKHDIIELQNLNEPNDLLLKFLTLLNFIFFIQQ